MSNDYVTHHNDWKRACEIAWNDADIRDSDSDRGYWRHQVETLNRLKADPPPMIETEPMADHFVKFHLRGPWPFHPVIHHISAADMGDPHDHPWPFRSVILHGWYREEVFLSDKAGFKIRKTGDSFEIAAGHIHRITEVSEGGCWTLIIPGEPERTPGFYQFREDGTYRRDWDGDWKKWDG